MDYRSGLSLSVSPTNSDQPCWAPEAFGPIWKKEKTMALIRKENGSEDLAKQRISNRPISVDSGTLLRERLGGFLSQPELILGIDSNCSGGREKRPGCVKKLRNRIKPKFSGGYVSKVWRLLNPGEIVVPTFQTSGLAGLQGTGNSRLLGATGRRGQPISTVNPLKTARKLFSEGAVDVSRSRFIISA